MCYKRAMQAMFLKKADELQKLGNKHWAKAKKGEGHWHYEKAKTAYRDAERNRTLAANVR